MSRHNGYTNYLHSDRHTDYSRSDGTFLGDAHGDAWAGSNHTEEQGFMDGMSPPSEHVDMSMYIHEDRLGYVCNRSVTHDQRMGLERLDTAMTVLFERMKHHTEQEKMMCDHGNYNSPAYNAMIDVPLLERSIHFYGYSGEGFLDELYEKLSALYTYVMRVRSEMSIRNGSPVHLFGYYRLVATCIRLCMEAISSTKVNDSWNPYDEDGPDGYACNPDVYEH